MIHYVAALPCEAKPIIEKLAMKPAGSFGQALFFSGENALLAISGIGSLASAIATASLASKSETPASPWLNIGICGHGSGNIGSLWRANKIAQPSKRETFYPQPCYATEIPGCSLICMDSPSSDYKKDIAYDMESYGFYSAAIRASTCELVHCLKIVSDNPQAPAGQKPDKAWVEGRIAAQLDPILEFAAALEKSAQIQAQTLWEKETYEKASKKLHFTATQAEQLKDLLQAAQAMSAMDQAETLLRESPASKTFLNELSKLADKAAFASPPK